MKKLLILTALCCISYKLYCQEISNENKVYTYVVPLVAEKIVYQKIQRFQTSYTVFLELEITDKGYDIWVIPTTKNIENAYFGFLKVLESNRTMHINGKLYPLVFSTDMTIGGEIDLNKVQSFEKRESKKREDEDAALLVQYRHVIYERAIVIRFDKDWNQIKE